MDSTAACHSACAISASSSVAFSLFDAFTRFPFGASVVSVRACAAAICAAVGHALMEATRTPIIMPATELVSISASLMESNESTVGGLPPRSVVGGLSPRSVRRGKRTALLSPLESLFFEGPAPPPPRCECSVASNSSWPAREVRSPQSAPKSRVT